jgi:hypothetical protein
MKRFLIILALCGSVHAQQVIVQNDYAAILANHKALLELKQNIRIEQQVYKLWKEDRQNDLALWRLKFAGGKYESPGTIYQNMRVGLVSYPSLKTPEDIANSCGYKLPMHYPLNTVMP